MFAFKQILPGADQAACIQDLSKMGDLYWIGQAEFRSLPAICILPDHGTLTVSFKILRFELPRGPGQPLINQRQLRAAVQIPRTAKLLRPTSLASQPFPKEPESYSVQVLRASGIDSPAI
jgi:hypothetical protein